MQGMANTKAEEEWVLFKGPDGCACDWREQDSIIRWVYIEPTIGHLHIQHRVVRNSGHKEIDGGRWLLLLIGFYSEIEKAVRNGAI